MLVKRTKSIGGKNILFWGVTGEQDPFFSKRIILTNILGLMFFTNMSISAISFLFLKQYYLAAFTFFFVLTELSWPFFNRAGLYNVSRLGMLISSNILGFFVSVLLPNTDYNRGFLIMAGLPLLLFSLKEKKSLLLGLLLPMVLYPVSEWAQYHIPGGFSLNLSESSVAFIQIAIGVIYVLLIFLMFLFFSMESARAEVLLNEQRSKSFSSAKFAALGEMAAGIAHEINNPMTVINLSADQIRLSLEDEQINKVMVDQKLKTILRTIDRIKKIIDSMRTFSREAKNDEMKPENLEKIIEDTMIFCSERFKNHGVMFVPSFDDQNIKVYCRGVQLSQVLLNLLNNSFDAIENLPMKWIKLHVRNEITKVVITITDSGTGIPMELDDKIFQPFFTTKEPGRGTGLGLSLSRKIVNDHGGQLYLDRSSFHTQFVIELPA